MRANPGGQLAPDDIIGRDSIISNLWRVLERQSLILSAERRLGKTSVVTKMKAEAPPGYLPVFRDLEQVHGVAEFAELLIRDVEDYLGKLGKTARRVREFARAVGGTEVAGLLKLPPAGQIDWKTLLTKTVEDLLEHQDRTVVLFWDEVPLMIANIRDREGEAPAMELLDTLRSLRQMPSNARLRMVFTGSIGLHNVIASLRRAGYANAPVNDMYHEEVPPLTPNDASKLARLLLEGEAVRVADASSAPARIAELVDRIPYYIHHVVADLARRGGEADESTVDQIVEGYLTDPRDRLNLSHYRERLNQYYPEIERTFALNMLDALATADRPLEFDELFNLLKAQVATKDRETALAVLELLRRDHYVLQERGGKLRFRFPLIQRWWRVHRGLTK